MENTNTPTQTICSVEEILNTIENNTLKIDKESFALIEDTA